MKKLVSPQISPNRRKAMGVHYTPRLLAQFVADSLVERLQQTGKGPIRILDPACGDGALLEALLASLEDAGQLRACEVIGVEADKRVLPEAESRLEKFAQVCFRLIPANFLDVVTRRRGQAELWETVTTDTEFDDSFDVVIANPPYVRTQILGAERAQMLAARYGLTGRVDLYHVFFIAATEVIRPGGYIGIITSNRFLSTLAGASVRAYLAHSYEIEEVIDLGDTKLFEAAVLPAIFIGRRRGDSCEQQARTQPHFMKIYSAPDQSADKCENLQSVSDVLAVLKQRRSGSYQTPKGTFKLTAGELNLRGDPKEVWSLATPEEAAWLARVRMRAWKLFEDVATVRVGIKTTANDVFIRSDWDTLPPKLRPEPELLRPLLRHEDARRWSIPDNGQPKWRVLYPHEVYAGKRRTVDLTQYPRAKAYLELNKERLEQRHYVIEAGRQWYEIWVPQDPKAWGEPKIVFPDISPEPRFYLDRRGYLVDGDCYWITLRSGVNPETLYLLLGLANSSILTRFHDLAFNNKLYSARRRYITQYVGKYPCPDPALSASKGIITLTKEILREIDVCKNQTSIRSLCCHLEMLVQEAFGISSQEGVP